MTVEHKQLVMRTELDWFYGSDSGVLVDQWVYDLVSSMNMNIMKGPISHYLDRPGLRGWSAVCLIETSHIALHTWDEGDKVLMQLDVYTCGHLDAKIIGNAIQPFLPSNTSFIVLDREYNIDIIDWKEP